MNNNKKRVELHCHTNMSIHDGVSSVEDIIQFAYDNGMPAIAITDTRKVLAFPDAYKKCRCLNDPDFKIIYGVEVNIVDDLAPIVENCQGQSLDSDIVVIDIDTMGYSPEYDDIVVLSAARIHNGRVSDIFFEHIKYDSADYNLWTIEEAFPDFQKFIGNDIIAAYENNHFKSNKNVFYAAIRKFGKPVTNTFINLTSLSNLLFPELTNHIFPESELSRKFKVTKGYGVEVGANILLKLIDILTRKGIRNLSEIQQLTINNTKYPKTLPVQSSTILVKNDDGIKDLYKLLTKMELEYDGVLPKSLLNQYRHNILIGSSGSNGVIQQKLALGFSINMVKEYAQYYDYLEIQPLSNTRELFKPPIYSHINSQNDLKNINRNIVRLGKMLNKPVVATSDAHFLYKDADIYARMRQAYHNDPSDCSGLYLRTTEEMLAEFAYLGKKTAHQVVVVNSNRICDMTEHVTPINFECAYPVIENANEHLRKLCLQKINEYYGDVPDENILNQLDYELNKLEYNGYDTLFLIVRKMICESGLKPYQYKLCGNLNNSLVAYLIGITHMDPIKHKLCNQCDDLEYKFVFQMPAYLKKIFLSAASNLPGIKAIKPGSLRLASAKNKTILHSCNEYENGLFLIPDNCNITDYTPLHMVGESNAVVTELNHHSIDHSFFKICIVDDLIYDI